MEDLKILSEITTRYGNRNVNELEFIDMKTGNLPGPWFTYVNVGEVDDLGWQRLSFGGLDYSPGNAPANYWINQPINALKLMFRADFPESEWNERFEDELRWKFTDLDLGSWSQMGPGYVDGD